MFILFGISLAVIIVKTLKSKKKRENFKNRNENIEINDLTDPHIYQEIFYSSHEELHEYLEIKPTINDFHTKTQT